MVKKVLIYSVMLERKEMNQTTPIKILQKNKLKNKKRKK